jgi:hypothetical protein
MVYIERGETGDVSRTIPEFRIKFKDVFSLKNLYIMMHEMLLEEKWLGFEGVESNEGHEDLETLYSENVYQKGIHFGGKEIWVWWRARKQYEGRTSTYFTNVLDIDWHTATLQEREIVNQGQKMRVQWGELEISFKPRIISDLGHKWEHHWLMKHFKHVYEHRFMHAYLEKREKELWRDVYRIQSKVKAYLNLKTWMPTQEPFHPKLYGYEGQF